MNIKLVKTKIKDLEKSYKNQEQWFYDFYNYFGEKLNETNQMLAYIATFEMICLELVNPSPELAKKVGILSHAKIKTIFKSFETISKIVLTKKDYENFILELNKYERIKID